MLLTRIDRTPVSRRKLFTPNGKGGRRKNGRITEIVHFYHAFILILSSSPSLSSVRVFRRSTTKQDIRFAAIDISVPTFYSCEFGNRYRIDDGFFSDLEKTGKILASRPRLPRVCHVRDENLLDYFQSIRNASNTGFRSPGYRFCTASPRSASAEGRDEGWRQDATPSLSRDPITDLLFALYSSLNEN